MNSEQFDDETLMAFADGELDDATSRRIEAALEIDDALAQRLAVFIDTRMAVASVMKPLIDEPVPDALSASVRRMAQEASRKPSMMDGENVISLRRREGQRPQGTRQQWLMPIAASVLAVATGIGGFMAGRTTGSTVSLDEAITVALDQQLSGSDIQVGMSETMHIVSSFIDGNGDLCREYELRREQSSTTTITCRVESTWVTRLALSSTQAEGYVPASSQDTIDAFLTSIEAGQPLAADAEKDRLAARSR